VGALFYVIASAAKLKRKFNLDTIAVTARSTTHLHIAEGAWCHLALVISPGNGMFNAPAEAIGANGKEVSRSGTGR
jgi:hypothetical protein